MFFAVCDTASNPSMARQPSQNTDEIGAKFEDPPGLILLFKITGVPRYSTAGSTVLCDLFIVQSEVMLIDVLRGMEGQVVGS
jgi:hypothetical protein